MTALIRRVGVVIPAHNEERLMGRCLAAVCRAAREVSVQVSTLVVLDDCRDCTEQICRSFPVDVIAVQARSVGIARHAGVSSLLSGVGDADSIWIANTDADSVVPGMWLRDQLDLASAGADAVVGTVGLADHHGLIRSRFDDLYQAGLGRRYGHAHVHGANFGIRASSYLRVGGFPPIPLHEDRTLLRRLDAAGVAVVRSSQIRVATSPRLRSRCDGGFASALQKTDLPLLSQSLSPGAP
jgi:glycosyltransferase involved in cell wall biosynthesis